MTKYRFSVSPTSPFSEGSGQLWYRVAGRGLPGLVQIRLGRGDDGQYICTGLAIDGAGSGAITTSGLKSIPLTGLVDEIVDAAARIRPAEDPAWVHMESIDLEAAGGFVLVDPTPPVGTSRPQRGGKGPSAPELKAFASAYREVMASTDRRRYAQALAQRLGLSVATVHRWKAQCQSAGLIGQKKEHDDHGE